MVGKITDFEYCTYSYALSRKKQIKTKERRVHKITNFKMHSQIILLISASNCLNTVQTSNDGMRLEQKHK